MRSAVLICAFVLALAVALVGCGGDDSGSTQPEPSAAESGPTDAPPEEAPTAPAVTSEAIEPPDAGSAMSDSVACELQTVPSQVPLEDGQSHVPALPDGFVYNSVPASQGPHHPDWLRWGVYEEPVPELNVVHNLEHGGITVQYGRDVALETVQELLDWYAEGSDAIIVAPHDGLGGDIALAAWTVEDLDQDVDSIYRSSEGNVLRCDGFGEAEFSDFRQNYRGRAPERIPIDRLSAGS